MVVFQPQMGFAHFALYCHPDTNTVEIMGGIEDDIR
jgi:hypothetical protein